MRNGRNNAILIKLFVVVVAIITIGLTIVGVTSGFLDTSGQAKDSIHSVDQTIFWGTWNVWLTNDHPSGQPGSTNYYSAIYSVKKNNTVLIQKIQAASGTDQKYIIKYINHYWVAPWELSSDVEIIDIIPISNT